MQAEIKPKLSALLIIICGAGTLTAHAVPHDVAPDSTTGVSVVADGMTHFFRVALTKVNPEVTAVKKGVTYYKVNEDATHYYAAASTWELPPGLTDHPAWGSTSADTLQPGDFMKSFEIVTADPHVIYNTLGLILTVHGKRLTVVDGVPGGGTGEDVDELWGSSFTQQSIEGFDPSTTSTMEGIAARTIVDTTSIAGTAGVGQRADLSYFPFHFKISLTDETGTVTVLKDQDCTAPIIHSSFVDWDTKATNADGTAKFPAGTYIVTLTVTPTGDGGSGATSTASVIVVGEAYCPACGCPDPDPNPE